MSAKRTRLNERAIENFRQYLRIESVHPHVNYDKCVEFLVNQAESLDLPCEIINVSKDKPVVIITWKGIEPQLPSIMLNSHMDVVPVFEDKWTHKPFAADIEDGKIYARGTQDMKSVGIQYLEAVRLLKLENVMLRRTIHITFVPDEEIGGIEGMQKFVKNERFKELNVGFAMDESVSSISNKYILFYAEKCDWKLKVHCPGQTSHGSVMIRNTAGEKVAFMLNKFAALREQNMKKLEENPKFNFADVDSFNVTALDGGNQINVIPPEFTFVVDARLTPQTDIVEFENLLNKWCQEAGEGVWIEYIRRELPMKPSKLDDTNQFWKAFKSASDELGLDLKIVVCPGTTDMRYLREMDIPAIGFSPMNNTPLLLHSHDEYIGIDTFLRGIDIYYKILSKLGNV